MTWGSDSTSECDPNVPGAGILSCAVEGLPPGRRDRAASRPDDEDGVVDL
jgi:hypothetical protein